MKSKELSKITALVLAAGMSTRMGTLKQLLPYKESNILSQVLKELNKSQLDQIILVLGYKHSEIEKYIDLENICLEINQDYTNEMLHSVILGLKKVCKTSKAIMIILGDQPLISCNLINEMISAYNQSNYGLLVPEYKGEAGHPVIINMEYSDEINTCNPNIGLKSLFEKFKNDIYVHKVEDNGILLDIDTPEDYEKLIKD